MREDGESLGRERRNVDLSHYYREAIAGYRAEFDGDELSFVRSLSAYVDAASDVLRLSDDAVIANSLLSFLREDGPSGPPLGVAREPRRGSAEGVSAAARARPSRAAGGGGAGSRREPGAEGAARRNVVARNAPDSRDGAR
jgi:hypothetical protein